MAATAHEDLSHLNRTYRPALMAYFLRRLRNHAEAEDMTQDVFVRLARADRAEVEQPDAYIFRIAANLLRDRARKEKVRFNYRAELAADEDLGVEPLDPSRIVSGQQALAALRAALKDLPEPARHIFVLYKLECVEKRVIAETFGLSISAVDRYLTKAMAHLVTRVREAEG
jgi:RNA polymerase sigma-70 factor (ECF subfamily)